MSPIEQLLDILCCPVTHAPLLPLSRDRLERLDAAISRGEIKDSGERTLTEPVTEALVTRDGKLAYPIVDGIPVLLEDRGIIMAQLDDPAPQ
jgi:uncharacterized protein YbaR (Trm112 family)